MTRVTFGMYRKGVREPAITLRSAAAANANFTLVTPMRTAQSAIARHHREGPAAARERMNRAFRESPYWGPKGTPQARGWADAIRRCYDTYADLSRDDMRPAFATSIGRDLSLPPDILGVHVDVLLLDREGYVPRLVFFDKNDLSRASAIQYAAPVWRVIENELGEGRVAGVEVWSLRQPSQLTVLPAEARAAMTQVANVVHRLVL
jgi:hypothetical protein